MLQRFASATLVAGIAIAVAGLFVLAIPGFTLKQASPALMIWCAAPCVWGLWAMAAPQSWVPHRLPLWGALLGLIVGSLGALVLNLPKLVLGWEFPFGGRAFAVLAIAVFYYILWTFVGVAYRRLGHPAPAATPTRAARAA